MGTRSLSLAFGDSWRHRPTMTRRHVEGCKQVGLEPFVPVAILAGSSLHGLHRARSRQAVARALAVPRALLPKNMASFDFGSFARSVSGSGAGPVQVSIEFRHVSSSSLVDSACRHWPDPLSDHMPDRLT